MNEADLRAYIEVRRREVENQRRHAVQQPGEWAADGAVHELDRLQAWMNLQRERDLGVALAREAAEARHRAVDAVSGHSFVGQAGRLHELQVEAER